ncbi:MAG: CDGSH iron-sulfur domain-containing protein [Pseudomonadota bacterium]
MSGTAKAARKASCPIEVTVMTVDFLGIKGRSDKQLFCDGSHKQTGFEPKKPAAWKDGIQFICGCMAIDKAPLCGGSLARH